MTAWSASYGERFCSKASESASHSNIKGKMAAKSVSYGILAGRMAAESASYGMLTGRIAAGSAPCSDISKMQGKSMVLGVKRRLGKVRARLAGVGWDWKR